MTLTLTETTHAPTCPLCAGDLLALDNELVDSVPLDSHQPDSDEAVRHGVATATARCTACAIDFL